MLRDIELVRFGVFVGQVDMNPALVPVYTESLRLCGSWLAETCLENPGVILKNYLERVRGSERKTAQFYKRAS